MCSAHSHRGGFCIKLITLNKNNEFRRVYNKGKQYVSPLLITYCLKNRNGFTKIGITTSKKIGCAVKRNRARRIIREAYRGLNDRIITDKGTDIVFIARGKTTRSTSKEIAVIMESHLKKAGLIK